MNEDNISATEKGIRFVLGGTMILSVLINPATPIWFAVVALYPVLTGIVNWDPCYAALHAVAGDATKQRYVPIRNPF